MIQISLDKIKQLLYKMTSSSVVQHTQYPTLLKGDSGASNHYVTPALAHQLQNTHFNPSITVTLPDETTINSTQSGNLNLPNLSTKATLAHVLQIGRAHV